MDESKATYIFRQIRMLFKFASKVPAKLVSMRCSCEVVYIG